jgi:hypothetical protein
MRRQCGWCPTLLPNDPAEWETHYMTVHGQAGWSVATIVGDDWDPSEITSDDPAIPGSSLAARNPRHEGSEGDLTSS